MEDRDKVPLVLAGMGVMGILWAFMASNSEVLPSVSFVLYAATMDCLLVLVVMCLGLHVAGCLFLGSAVHLFLSGLAAMTTIEVFSPAVQGGAGLFWLIILSILLLQARSNKLPQRG